MNRFVIAHTNPALFSVVHDNPALIALAHTNPALFSVVHDNPALIALAHTNPALFSVVRISVQTNLLVNSVITDNPLYPPGEAITVTVGVFNQGNPGSQIIEWQLVDDQEVVISSGTQSSGLIGRMSSENVELTDVFAPEEYSEFRIRARIIGDPDWQYSSVKYCLPTDLSVTSVTRILEYYAAGASVPINVNVVNEGFAGSQVIEWEIWNGSSTLSSGSQSSGVVGDFGVLVVALSGILSPSGGNYVFYIRARVQGSDTWIYSQFMTNFTSTPPPNPTPRG